MEAVRKLIARKMFRLRVYEAKGVEYQRLFEKVMQHRHQGFVPVKPYGNAGDRKNDGYIPTTGTFFQVYAPENPSSHRTVVTAAAKAKQDFEGLVEHWDGTCKIRVFRFGFNDSYRGSPPEVELALAGIKGDHGVEATVFLAKDLENEALELLDDQLFDVINAPVPEVGLLPDVDFRILSEVINHVLRARTPIPPTPRLQAPNFAEKILFNGLTSAVANFLTFGSYQSEVVGDYFSKNSTFARQQLRDELASMYTESRTRLGDSVGTEGLGDLVFFDLLKTITPREHATIAASGHALHSRLPHILWLAGPPAA